MSGSRALPLLCRKTRVLPPDVMRLVRECLRVPLGPRCPRWISDLLWAKLRALPRGRNCLITVSFRASESIEYGIYRQDEIDFGTIPPRPCHLPTRSGLPSSGRKADDSPVRVDVRLEFTDRRGRWLLRCMQGNNVLRAQVDLWWMNDITELLSEVRSRFD